MAQAESNDTDSAQSRRYETPTFDPRSAFARTLRSGEMARLERQRRLPAEKQADVLVATS